MGSDRYKNKFWHRFFEALANRPAIGGLEISKEAMHFVILEGNSIKTASLRLPPQMLGDGFIKDKKQFKLALEELKNQIKGKEENKKKIPVMVSLPFSRSYVQVFSLPPVDEKEENEAVRLNVQMVSPIPLEKSYYDWQKIEPMDGQSQFLGGFALSKEVDEFVEALNEGGFSVVAVEFNSLALTRFLISGNTGVNVEGSYLVLDINSNGLEFLVLKNGNLNFDYFVGWKEMAGNGGGGGGGVKANEVKIRETLAGSLQQVTNFYANRVGQAPKSVLVTVSGEEGKIIGEIIKNEFGMEPVWVRSQIFTNFGSAWFKALGLAIRGRLPRQQDDLISVARIGTEDEYRNMQIKAFIKLWRTVYISAFSFLLITLGSSYIFLSQTLEKLKDQERLRSVISDNTIVSDDIQSLRSEADGFNKLLKAVKQSETDRRNWASFIKKINDLSGKEVTLERIFYQAPEVPVIISGKSASVEQVLAFRDKIEKEENFKEVELPLSNVIQAGTEVSFNLSFSFKNSPAL